MPAIYCPFVEDIECTEWCALYCKSSPYEGCAFKLIAYKLK